MSWVKQGGEGEGWQWVDDGQGNPAVQGDNANNFAPTASGILNQAAPAASSGGWKLPGKGQWNNQPYEYGPSDWRGIPFSQRDTSGAMLSKYSNAVDQLQAARQPISVGQQFGRWNFGGVLPNPGGGGPPVAVDRTFHNGILPDNGGGYQPNFNLDSPPSPGAPQPGSGAPATNNNNFGPTIPNQPTTNRSWQSFTFANPQSGFEQNFNYLAGIDPNLAFSYGLQPQAPGNVVKRGVDAYTGSNIGNLLIGAFNEPQAGTTPSWLGVAQGWTPPKYGSQWNVDATGKGLTYGGKNYTLPWADTAYIPQTPWWQGGTTPMTSAPDAGAGSDAWWSAVLGK